mgnify:CR=1 FL=1|jgi:hypothetical protein
MKIVPENPKIDIKSALDLIGKDFRFDHVKGVAEWLKNSVDAYNQLEVPDSDQEIIIFLDLRSNDFIRKLEVLDFVGMSKGKIDEAFKVWFSPSASKISNENIISSLKTYGGHGNGGKFYMRQMFNESRAITYYKGRLNAFGFNAKKDYGYVLNYDDVEVEPRKAIEFAELYLRDLPEEHLNGILTQKHGFTLIQGINPKKSPGTNYKIQLAEKLVKNPQARRLIERKKIYIQLLNDNRRVRLKAQPVTPRDGFDSEFEFVAPEFIEINKRQIKLTNSRYSLPPKLRLKTSKEPLRGGKLAPLNSIDFLGEIGVIANYLLHEISSMPSSFSEFIYGECECPIMEDAENDLVRNDREKFVKHDRTEAILLWISGCVIELARSMEVKQKEEKRNKDLSMSSTYNQILDTWKNNFLKKLLREQLFGDDKDIPGIGGTDGTGPILGSSKGSKGKKAKKKDSGDTGGVERKKKDIHPRVLISDHDEDPFSEDKSTFSCDPRHPAVYQRRIDTQYGIYWINTSKALANKILTAFGSDSPRWRSYLFQRYIDIIVKESIFQLGSRQVEVNIDTINAKIDEIISSVEDKAATELNDFLFSNKYDA